MADLCSPLDIQCVRRVDLVLIGLCRIRLTVMDVAYDILLNYYECVNN